MKFYLIMMVFAHLFRSSVRSFKLPALKNRLARSTLRQHYYQPIPHTPKRNLVTLPVQTTEIVDIVSNYNTAQDTSEVILSTKLRRGGRKVRQHVNPLSTNHRRPLQLDSDWMNTAFEKIGPGEFIVDIGCAKGAWALDMCKRDQDINIVGLEIRVPIVELCLIRKAEEDIRNVHFLKSNANVDLDNIFGSLSTKGIAVNTVTVQFPDPHFKVKHKKRRVVNGELVQTIAKNLQPGARVFLQTDIEELGYDMVSYFKASEYFAPAEHYNAEALHTNSPIYEVQTEREICTLREDKPVYRMLFYRNDIAM